MISAIVLAAGKSRRMGKSKLKLPWGESTVIGKVVSTLMEAGISDIHIVIGANQDELKDILKGIPVKFVYNPDYEFGEMITSVQAGITSLGDDSEAAMIVLGDQPQVETQVIKELIDNTFPGENKLIVPSYQNHRGHPWILTKPFWADILELKPTDTLRDFLHQKQADIKFILMDSPSIIQDLDTPEDYARFGGQVL